MIKTIHRVLAGLLAASLAAASARALTDGPPSVAPAGDGPPAIVPLSAQAVAAANIAERSATIDWRTNEPGDSQVEYGLTPGYGSASSVFQRKELEHSVILAGLEPGTTYHVRVKSTDALGQSAYSPDYVFVTQQSLFGQTGAGMLAAAAGYAAPAPAALAAPTPGGAVATGGDGPAAPAAGLVPAAPAASSAPGYVGPPEGAAPSAAPASPAPAASAPTAALPVASDGAPAPAASLQPAAPSGVSDAQAKAPQKFLSPNGDGVNDTAVFGPEAGEVTVVDVTGRRVFHARKAGAPIVWDCRDGRGRVVESGVYIARIVKSDGKATHQTFAVVK